MEQKDKTKELVPDGHYRCEVKKVCTVTGSTNGKEWIRLDLECDIAYGPYRYFFAELHRQKKQIWPNAYWDFKLSYFFNSDGTMQANMIDFFNSLQKGNINEIDPESWVGAEFGAKIAIDEANKNVIERIMTYSELLILPQDTISEQVKPIFNSSMNTSINNSTFYQPQTNGKQGWNLHTNQRPSTPLYKPSPTNATINTTETCIQPKAPPPSPLPKNESVSQKENEIDELKIKLNAEYALLQQTKNELYTLMCDLVTDRDKMFASKREWERKAQQISELEKELQQQKNALLEREEALREKQNVIDTYGIDMLGNIDFKIKCEKEYMKSKAELDKREQIIIQKEKKLKDREDHFNMAISAVKGDISTLKLFYPEYGGNLVEDWWKRVGGKENTE